MKTVATSYQLTLKSVFSSMLGPYKKEAELANLNIKARLRVAVRGSGKMLKYLSDAFMRPRGRNECTMRIVDL